MSAPARSCASSISRCGSAASSPSTTFRSRPRAAHHRPDRPERGRQDHGVQLHHRFLQADRGTHRAGARRGAIWNEIETLTDRGTRSLRHGDGTLFLLERMPDYLVTQQARVARTFQNIRLFSGMTVFENMLVAQHNTLMVASGYTLIGVFAPHLYGRAEKTAVEKARYWLDKMGLIDRADDPAGDLPYGGQRRLEIARAMCTDPVLLCLDEPAAGLNPRESHELNELLLSIRDEHATSILLIEHDMSVVMQISDHVIVLDYGVKISDGTPEAVRNDQKVIAAYLGVEDEEVEKVEAEVGL